MMHPVKVLLYKCCPQINGSFWKYRSTDYVIQKKEKTKNKTTPNKD